MNITIEYLNKFCRPSGRASIATPWTDGHKTWVTNGFIGIELDARIEGVTEEAAIDARPAIDQVLADYFAVRDREFIALPPLPELAKCPLCRGTGKANVCMTCKGDGEFTHDGKDYDCKTCESTGTVWSGNIHAGEVILCQDCEGFGLQSDVRHEVAPNAGYNLLFLHQIAQFPNVRFSVPPFLSTQSPAVFTFDGGRGVIMPMRA